MKKIYLTSSICMLMACPAMADIALNNNNPTCDSSTIGATSGDTALDATWTANTLNLKFMANGQQFASNTCTYGQNITIPTGTPTRTGYNFAGWQLATNSGNNQCNINNINETYPMKWVYQEEDMGCIFETDDGSDDVYGCRSEEANGLVNYGDWKAYFAQGVIQGTSLCSNISGTTPYYVGTTSDTPGQYCWCKITKYTPNDNNSCEINSSWVFLANRQSKDNCDAVCGNNCSYHAKDILNSVQ